MYVLKWSFLIGQKHLVWIEKCKNLMNASTYHQLFDYVNQNLFKKYLVTFYNSDHNYIFCPDMKGFFVEPLSPARPCSSRIYWKTSLKKLLNFRNFSKKVFIWSRFFKGVYKIPNSESFGDLRVTVYRNHVLLC